MSLYSFIIIIIIMKVNFYFNFFCQAFLLKTPF